MEGLSTLLQSFADLLTPVVKFMIWLWPIKVYRLHDGEMGVMLTMGKARGKAPARGPGVHLAGPFQEIETIQALGGYVNLDQQVIVEGGSLLVVNGAIQYQVTDPVRAILYTEELEPLVKGVCMNTLRENVADLRNSEKLTHELCKRANVALRANGARVDKFMITDLRPHDVAMAVDAFIEATDKVIKWRKEDGHVHSAGT